MLSIDDIDFDLSKLNSLTKYPSIPTYHELGERGILKESHVDFAHNDIICTEKVDGTNARIIAMPDSSYILGSREDLLYASGDIIHNPALGIVDFIRPFANKFRHSDNCVRVFYGELFGGKVGAASKNYSRTGAVGWRLFDVVEIWNYEELYALEKSKIAAWRDNGGQTFLSECDMLNLAESLGMSVTPRLLLTESLPDTVSDTYSFLKAVSKDTLVALDDTANKASEGIVVRTSDRKLIAKIRHEDYERTIKKRK